MVSNIHPEDLKAQVRRRGITMRDLAVRYALNPGTLSNSLRRPIPDANAAIADYLGTTVGNLWPSWYHRDGRRRLDRAALKRRQSLRFRKPAVAE